MNKSSKSKYCLCIALLLACSFILQMPPMNADTAEFQKINPEKLLEAVRKAEKARAVDGTMLNYAELDRNNPIWPISVFLTGEILRLRGENAAARQAYNTNSLSKIN